MTFELRKNIGQYFLFLFIGSIVAMVAMAVIIIRQHEGQEMGWAAIAAMTMIGVSLSIPLVLTTDHFLEDFSNEDTD